MCPKAEISRIEVEDLIDHHGEVSSWIARSQAGLEVSDPPCRVILKSVGHQFPSEGIDLGIEVEGGSDEVIHVEPGIGVGR